MYKFLIESVMSLQCENTFSVCKNLIPHHALIMRPHDNYSLILTAN